MKKELENKLYEKFPWVKPTDGFGIGVGDGWYDLIYNLCVYIDMGIKFENSCIEDYKKDIEKGKQDNWTWKPNDSLFTFPIVHQIKEKFGCLRFYAGIPTGTRYEFGGAIHLAEQMSGSICEMCGNGGRTRRLSWVRTLCRDCLRKHLNQHVTGRRFINLKQKEADDLYDKLIAEEENGS